MRSLLAKRYKTLLLFSALCLKKNVRRVIAYACDLPTVMEATVSITASSINIEDLNHVNEGNL